MDINTILIIFSFTIFNILGIYLLINFVINHVKHEPWRFIWVMTIAYICIVIGELFRYYFCNMKVSYMAKPVFYLIDLTKF